MKSYQLTLNFNQQTLPSFCSAEGHKYNLGGGGSNEVQDVWLRDAEEGS